MKSEKKLFKLLHNGKEIRLSYQYDKDEVWTIYLRYKEERFWITSYQFVGNDTGDESNYLNETTVSYPTFYDMIMALTERFHGIKIYYTHS